MSEDLPGIAFLDAEACCKWPVSGDGLDLRVCGGKVAKGKSYCAPHHMLAYVPQEEVTDLLLPREKGGRRWPREARSDEGLAIG